MMKDHIDCNRIQIINENNECVGRLCEAEAALAAAKILCRDRCKMYVVRNNSQPLYTVRPVMKVAVESHNHPLGVNMKGTKETVQID